MSACTTSPPASPATLSSSSGPAPWVSVTQQAETVRPDELATDRPNRIAADADVCALLTEQEITAATGAPFARTGRPLPGTLCLWQLGDAVDDRGTPTETLTLTSALPGGWLGEEQGVVGGYPTRRQVGDGLCTLKVGLRRPDAPTDKVVLTVGLHLTDKSVDPCPATQTLAETALSRVPNA
ncbi:DUF3558 domain-containing protein [Saccharothrix luteola]|uniref:DUF3558 domain-containing protein n=1 Tax=Saccharothrix luteola TaxID=2893018 RepID=UPI001E380283|nr:DUF3558 domain-containing protein [Saccharothrix luteola]MCC8249810.1 DUF3558 domain-containing protein [Saccharothrix luteola]